jgi:asparagine synthase (glutamine-hydrolysing)
MCGIAGVVGERNDGRIDRATIHQMCQTMVHRGPDDEGVFVQNGVGLGMRRLSVIDLASGHQPIFNEDRSIAVVLNGEIYNFLELREQLESRGHQFSSQSDTEVIVHLYDEL